MSKKDKKIANTIAFDVFTHLTKEVDSRFETIKVKDNKVKGIIKETESTFKFKFNVDGDWVTITSYLDGYETCENSLPISSFLTGEVFEIIEDLIEDYMVYEG